MAASLEGWPLKANFSHALILNSDLCDKLLAPPFHFPLCRDSYFLQGELVRASLTTSICWSVPYDVSYYDRLHLSLEQLVD